jgi:hypothetical protein
MLAPRHAPAHTGARLRRIVDLADGLHARDRAFFYMALRVEEVL